jgi:hypothetical protein
VRDVVQHLDELFGHRTDVYGPQMSIADILLNPASLAGSIIQQAAELETMLPHPSALRPSAIVRVVVA